jgi:DNA modification methylase
MKEINRLELVWPGKYDNEGNLKVEHPVSLPFQIVERVNESRATRTNRETAAPTLFDIWEQSQEVQKIDDRFKNKLIWGDNRIVMESLLGSLSGKIDLIYIDPPFAVGSDFKLEIEIGDEEITKEASLIEEVAYRDTWGKGNSGFVDMMFKRLLLMKQLLSPTGSIYVHIDSRTTAMVRMLMDEIFGSDSFQREIIWRIGWVSGYKSAANNWIRNHDTILYYVNDSQNFTFNKEYIPYPPGYVRRDGSAPTAKGYPIEDVWNASPLEHELTGEQSLDSIQIKSFSREKTGYATQKNESLLRRIIQASSNEGDLVADFFCGSGTTMAVAEKLNRKWLGADLGRFAIHTTRKRLLDIEDCKPFEILNLGNYERQHWSRLSFGEDSDGDGVINYLEYISFILKLYGATPIKDSTFIHGKKSTAFVHVGAVTSPVTIKEIEDSITEVSSQGGKELHVLGWEWEMGLIDTLVDFAKSKSVKLSAFQIPREVMEAEAARKGQVTFFELSYLEAAIEPGKRPREYVCSLEDFVIPNPELIPDEVRKKIKSWKDYIDYWAVDWDFQNDTFIPAWMDYRTKADRNLKIKTSAHAYPEPGEYKVMVKVVDIFGNDSSKIYHLKVK